MLPGFRVRIHAPRSVGEQFLLASFATTYGLRSNALDNPEAAANANGWGGNLATVARSTSGPLLFGPASVKVDCTNAASSGVFVQASASARVPVVAGIGYAFSIHVEGTGAVGKMLRLVPHYYLNPGNGGSPDFTDLSPTFTLVAGWQRLSFVSIVPATAAYALLALYTPSAQGAFTIYVVGAQIEDSGEQGVLSPFFGKVGLYNPLQTTYSPDLGEVGGRRSTIDFLSRDVKGGNLSLDLGDARIGGSETQRAVTALIGNAQGVPQLGGCLTEVDFAEDVTAGVVAWERWFTGRIDETSAPDGATIAPDLVDLAQELSEVNVFTSTRPHAAVTYAIESQAWPLGLSAPYANFPVAPTMSGSIGNAATGGGKAVLLDKASISRGENTVSEALLRAGLALGYRAGVQPGQIQWLDGLYARVKQTSGGGAGTVADYEVGGVTNQVWVGAKGSLQRDFRTKGYEIHSIYLRARPGGTAVPADGTAVEVSLRTPGFEPTEQTPLLLVDANAAQILADALDGHFSRLDEAGNVTRSWPRDAASFATLIADPTLPRLRLVKTAAQSLDSLLKELCLQSGLGWRFNDYGQVELLDLRTPTSLAGVPALTDADLAGVPSWSHSRRNAVGSLELTYYVDRPVRLNEGTLDGGILSIDSSALLKTIERPVTTIDLGRLDLGDKPLVVKATGFRAGLGEVTNGVSREAYLRGLLLGLVEQVRHPFAYGPMEVTAQLQRNATTKAIRPGDLLTYDWSTVPNPATNQRGGARVGRLIERNEEDGIYRVAVLDLGPNVSLAAPTLGALAAQTGNTLNGLTVTVTLNASADPVAVEVAVTDNSVTLLANVPAGAWNRFARVTATGSLTLQPLPSGSRIWVRARSEVGPNSIAKLPSAYVVAGSGNPYLDLGAMSAPTGLAVGTISALSAILTWSLGGNTTAEVWVYLASPSSDAVVFTYRLAPGTTRHVIEGTTNAATYKAAVRFADGSGGLSPLSATVTWTASGTAPKAPAPLALELVGQD